MFFYCPQYMYVCATQIKESLLMPDISASGGNHDCKISYIHINFVWEVKAIGRAISCFH